MILQWDSYSPSHLGIFGLLPANGNPAPHPPPQSYFTDKWLNLIKMLNIQMYEN